MFLPSCTRFIICYNLFLLALFLIQLECLRSEIHTAATWLPILVIHIRSQVKRKQSQSYKFKKIAKNSNFEILQETLHKTNPLKLLDKMYKYEMDPSKTVGTTERTQGAGRTDGRTNRWTDGVKPIHPPTTSLCGGYNKYYGDTWQGTEAIWASEWTTIDTSKLIVILCNICGGQYPSVGHPGG